MSEESLVEKLKKQHSKEKKQFKKNLCKIKRMKYNTNKQLLQKKNKIK
jgi:hypothetical protein